MANNIEWIDADAAEISWTVEPREIVDPSGSSNAGCALRFGNIVIEGPVPELTDFVVRLEQAISEIEDELAENGDR